jgi:hypothetical protein
MNFHALISTLRRAMLVFLCTLPLACNSARDPETHPVRGEVFLNGKPAAGASIVFHPVDEENGSQAFATVKEDGSFVMSTFGVNDGAELGDYIVTLNWRIETKPEGDDPITGPDLFGERYTTPKVSKLKFTVKAGENLVPRYDLKD